MESFLLGWSISPQTSEGFEHVFIYSKKPVVHWQMTQLGFEGHFIFFLDIDMCVRVVLSEEYPNEAESEGGSLGWFLGGLVLDPHLFWRLNQKQHTRWCKNVQTETALSSSKYCAKIN